MGKIHVLKSRQQLPVSLERAWDFFSNPHNLLTITPPFLNLKVTNEIYGDAVYTGQIITYKVKPLPAVTLPWLTEITHVENGKMFVDEQRKGPYRLWHHQHHFKKIEGGIEMIDVVHYRVPFGMIGELFHPMVRKKLTEIFVYRFNKVNELFGDWPGQQLMLNFDGNLSRNS